MPTGTAAERRARKIEFLKLCLKEFELEPSYFDHLRKAAEDNLYTLEHPELATPSFRDIWGQRPHGGYVSDGQRPAQWEG